MAFSDHVNKQERYSVCMQHLKTSKLAANTVRIGSKARKKESLMFLEGEMQEPMYA